MPRPMPAWPRSANEAAMPQTLGWRRSSRFNSSRMPTPTWCSPASTCQNGQLSSAAGEVSQALQLDPKNAAALGLRQALQSKGQQVQ